MIDSRKTGEIGENIVANWLETQHAQILKRRWLSRMGEIDLIASTSDQTIALIEVKTRSSRNWDMDGLLAISLSKQRKLWKTAELFIAAHPQWADRPYRFDLALVTCSQSPPPTAGLFTDSQQGYYFSLHTYLENAFEG